jgi:hypothetical protein
MADIRLAKGGYRRRTSISARRISQADIDIRLRISASDFELRQATGHGADFCLGCGRRPGGNPKASTALRGSCEPPCASSPRRRLSCASRSGHPPRSRRSSSSPSRQAARWRVAAGRSVLRAGSLPGRGAGGGLLAIGHGRARVSCTPSPRSPNSDPRGSEPSNAARKLLP